MDKNEIDQERSLAVFQGQGIRRIWCEEQWFFSVVDIIDVLTDSSKPRDYWYRLKEREKESSGIELSTNCRRLKLLADDGKMRETDCSNTEGLFRIIQSIPSKKAEPFKRWLAKVGYERIQDIEDPDRAMLRMREMYRAKGYSEEWIDKRMRGMVVRQSLTNEWDERGVEKGLEYAMLTSEITEAAFGIDPREYKRVKGLGSESLRDHMTDMELIFTMLGEASTTEIVRCKDVQGFGENREAARKGGTIAGDARKKLELETGHGVVSSENYISEPEKKKRLSRKKTELGSNASADE